jgi:hypothetical protein
MTDVTMLSSLALLIASRAACRAKQCANEEEEEMTTYHAEEQSPDWEFKILRSISGKFRDPAWMREILWEERQAGWTLVEKFDDSRLRLRRLASADFDDEALGFDPMRTWVGTSPRQYTAIRVAAAFALVAALMVVFPLLLKM